MRRLYVPEGGNAVKRGGCLTAYLLLGLILTPLNGLWLLLKMRGIQESLPPITRSAVPVLTFISLVNIAFLLAIWKWKRWGCYGFCASTFAAFLYSVIIGVPVVWTLVGLVPIVIIVILIRPIWHHFE